MFWIARRSSCFSSHCTTNLEVVSGFCLCGSEFRVKGCNFSFSDCESEDIVLGPALKATSS
ncbi:uncharacterized protein G2W53_034618 [Senna tora]|uniref:Uncharacterized protein n=1 Tax=Senna tora TaxID=362788 RepID=A0A834T266_9FABA|nr:uncharacterized protein G2W53_034618 [Senna tora]